MPLKPRISTSKVRRLVIAPSMPSERRLENPKLSLRLPRKVQQDFQNSELKSEFPVEFRPTIKYNGLKSVGRIF